MKKSNDLTCLVYVVIAIILVIIYKTVEFLKDPNAIHQIIEFFEAIGICIGSAILLFLCFYIFETISTKIKQRFILQSKEYSVRCDAIKMKKFDYGPIPDDLPEESAQDTHYPIFTNIVIANYGIWITERQNKSTKVLIDADNTSRNNYFFTYLENSIIPISDIKLYYVAYRREGNLEFEYGPSKSAGFTDATPKLSKEDQLKIVIIFTCIIEKNNLQKVIRLEQPTKLKLIVLNENGDDDLIATAGLYKVIYERIKSIETDDDDSWMYRSRPIYW